MKHSNLCLFLATLSAALISCNGGSTAPSGSGIGYQTLNYNGSLGSGNSTGLTGIRGIRNSSDVYITGSYAVGGNNGTLYKGPITGGGDYYTYNYPGSSGSNVYSVENGNNNNVLLVGSYITPQFSESHNYGFLYNGPIPDDGKSWESLVVPSNLANGQQVNNTIPHSIMGELVVGNYLAPSVAGNAFIYNITSKTYSSFSYPDLGVRYTSAYGVWFNGGSSYTITGGFSHEDSGTISYGYVVDYDSVTQTFNNWESYTYNNLPNAVTHFEGITADVNGGYNLAGEGATSDINIAFVHIERTPSGGFGPATWINAWYPGSTTTTADTVYQNYLLGVYKVPGSSVLNGYVATIPTNSY